MHDRSILGPADVTDDQLTALVAELLRRDVGEVRVLDSVAHPVDYDLTAITTAGRFWVRGTARVGAEDVPFGFFVKHVQSWGRSPLMAEVPAHLRAFAEAGVPWRTEPLVYRSDLDDRLPAGLRMARALGVFDLDELSASVWLEVVDAVPVTWNSARFRRAAGLLGRLAASERVRERAGVGRFPWSVRDYLEGRLTHQVLPMLRSEEIWQHPLVAGAFDDELRGRMRRAADRVDDLVDELASMPLATGHGDACPNNLLVTAGGDGFVLIDYGFWGELPVGFDLGQLLVGDVQLGRGPAAGLAEVERVIVPAYVEGLHAEGWDLDEAVVRRAHALHLMTFTGLSCLPFEHLGKELTPPLRRLAAERAAVARFSLDLLERTSAQVSSSPG